MLYLAAVVLALVAGLGRHPLVVAAREAVARGVLAVQAALIRPSHAVAAADATGAPVRVAARAGHRCPSAG